MDEPPHLPLSREPVVMKRRPALVLIAGLSSLAMGLIFLWIDRAVQGVYWYGVGIVLTSLLLIVLWYRDRDVVVVQSDAEVPKGSRRFVAPGNWYIPAMFAIVIAQVVCYLVFVRK